jgi:RNA polymerase sigma-70 factor (ECF subfamily)
MVGTKRFWPEDARVELGEVNGQPALIIYVDGQTFSIVTIDADAGQIEAIRIIANPEKLTRV